MPQTSEDVASGLGAAGSLRFGANKPKKFPPHILIVVDNDISNNFDNHESLSRW